MANTFLDVTLPAAIERMAARVNARCVLAKKAFIDYSEDFKKYGDTIQTELPNYFTATNFSGTTTTSDYHNQSVNIQMNQLPDITFEITAKRKTLNLEDFDKQVTMPMVDGIVSYIERVGYNQIYKEVWNTTGTAGTPPSKYADLINAKTFLDKFDASQMNRFFMLDPLAYNALVSNQTSGLGMLNVFNENVSKELFDGYLGEKGGMELYQSNYVPIHTAGNVTTTDTIQVNVNSSDDDTSISLKGFDASTGSLKAGDVFTIAGVYSMNPLTRLNTGVLQRFVVTSDVTANSAGVLSANIEPRIVSPASTSSYQQYISVSSLPLQNAAVTVLTAGAADAQTSHQNMLVGNNAVALVTRPLALPEGGVKSYLTTYSEETPIQFRVTLGYDMSTKKEIMSVDCLFGFKTISPWFCAKLLG